MGLIDWVIETPSVRAGFTSLRGGVSRSPYEGLNLGLHVGDDPESVARNRALLESEAPGIAWMDQVHGDHVEVAVPGSTAARTDGLIVDPRLGSRAAAVMVADCVPLLLVDVERPLGAAVHVGRAGLLNGIALRAVAQLRERGADALVGVVGPSICGKCYEVPREMSEEAERIASGSASTTSWGTPGIDIPAGLAGQLGAAGGIEVRRLNVCTLENEDYFSHRRAGTQGTTTGRFAGIVHILKDTPA